MHNNYDKAKKLFDENLRDLNYMTEKQREEFDSYNVPEELIKKWKQDYADDEAGMFPKDLKRGVLSEDGIWNLLSDWQELEERLRSLRENQL